MEGKEIGNLFNPLNESSTVTKEASTERSSAEVCEAGRAKMTTGVGFLPSICCNLV